AGGGLAHARLRFPVPGTHRARRLPRAVPALRARRHRAKPSNRFNTHVSMINYDQFLSRSAGQMRGSAIRKMGTVLAQSREIISFAPGYPSPETFPWSEFTEITRELLSGADG